MTTRPIAITDDISFGGNHPPLFIAGPCVIESREHALRMARTLLALRDEMKINLVFKSSFDKANRSSIKSYRGPGLAAGLRALARVREETGLPLLTDVHEPAQCAPAAEVCDVLQIPAFLCRQTDLLAHLMQRPGRVFTREELLGSVWGYAAHAGTRTVDVHVAQVRGKLGDASPLARDVIRTVRGVGYTADELET